MAQPQQQYPPPPRPYASPHTTPSPIPPGSAAPAFAAPPIKRAQNSPSTPTSPYSALHSPTIGVNGIASFQTNPYHSQGSNPYPLPPNHATTLSGSQPQARQTPSTPVPQPTMQQQQHQQQQPPLPPPPPLPQQQQQQQQPSQTAMGPPPTRPDDDKPMDLNEIQDVMTGSGIDLKAEEAALFYDAGSRRVNNVNTGPPQGYFDPQRNTLQANIPGGRDSFYGSGPFNQAATATSPRALEDEMEAREKLALRRRNERDQYHSNNPFLQNKIVLQRITSATQKTQTAVSMDGVFHPQRPITTRLIINGPEGQERIATLTKEPLLSTTAPMVDILSLLSLAARERLRNVVEDMSALARGRRLTASGVVPPDFADIALGAGKPMEATGVQTPLIGAGSPDPESRKRSHSQAIEQSVTPSESMTQEAAAPVPTIAFPDLISRALQKQAEEDAAFEREREAKRQKRTTANLISGSDPASRVGSIPGSPAPGTPGPIDAIAPETKLTKKEQKRREDERSAASAAKDTRNAMAMALGGSKKFSWMTGGKGGGGGLGSSFGKRTPAGTPAKKQAEASVSTPPATGAVSSPVGATVRGNRVLGGPREDREDGRGIQMRDAVSVLGDGHEKKTLSKAYGRLK